MTSKHEEGHVLRLRVETKQTPSIILDRCPRVEKRDNSMQMAARRDKLELANDSCALVRHTKMPTSTSWSHSMSRPLQPMSRKCQQHFLGPSSKTLNCDRGHMIRAVARPMRKTRNRLSAPITSAGGLVATGPLGIRFSQVCHRRCLVSPTFVFS